MVHKYDMYDKYSFIELFFIVLTAYIQAVLTFDSSELTVERSETGMHHALVVSSDVNPFCSIDN